MASTGRYLKVGRGCTTPSVVIGISVEPKVLQWSHTDTYCDEIFGRAVASISTKTRGKWSKPRIEEFDNTDELHKWVRHRAVDRKRNYIITPCASRTLVLTKWWEYAERHGVLFTPKGMDVATIDGSIDLSSLHFVSRMCLRGKPDILSYRHFCKSYMWLSGVNYFDASETVLADSVSHLIPEGYRDYRNHADSRKRLIYQCVLWQTAFCALVDWWRFNARAPFGLTVGQLAIGILRSYLVPKSLSTHSNESAHKLERIACYGGRASLWYVGNIGNGFPQSDRNSRDSVSADVPNISGPISHIDVRSMYPTILRDSSFPCKFHKHWGPVKPSQLADLQRYYGTIANVRVRIHNAEYPLRTNTSVIYPRGVFQTVLAGPDLEALAGRDEILEVYDCVTYILGKPFSRAADFLLKARLAARKQRDLAWELFAKTLGASLGGKLAQKSGHWVDHRNKCADRLWGEWVDYNADTGTGRRFRAVSGMVSEYIEDSSGKGPFTACFAYLTAYGRQLMRRVRECFDTETVVSQDTDGLWILGDIPYDRLRGVIQFGDEPGQMQLKGTSANGYFITPKHYYTDFGWVLSGLHNPIPEPKQFKFKDSYDQNPLVNGCRNLPIHVRRVTRVSTLMPLQHTSGRSPFGWVRPLYIDPPDEISRHSD